VSWTPQVFVMTVMLVVWLRWRRATDEWSMAPHVETGYNDLQTYKPVRVALVRLGCPVQAKRSSALSPRVFEWCCGGCIWRQSDMELGHANSRL
jgi:hypothetical protein